MNNDFVVELFGDLDYKGMVVNISYKGELVASVNYEKGVGNMEIQLSPRIDSLAIPLEDFLLCINKAKSLAKKCAKEDEEMREKGLDLS